MRRRRRLTDEERALWELVASRTKKIDRPEEFQEPAPPRVAEPRPHLPLIPAPTPIPRFAVGQKASAHRPHNIAPPIHEALHAAPLNMDHKVHARMKRGKLDPEGRIDLHGMTISEAHSELVAFILTAQQAGKRLVLVITGKGKDRDDGGPIPSRIGVLRHQVPQWLRLPPLGQAVMQITPAHLRHGGTGAYYVYLRRTR